MNPSSLLQQRPDTTIIDTMNYIMTDFVNKKANYIGKPFSTLLNDLKINIDSYVFGVAPNNRTISPDLSVSFLSVNQEFLARQTANKPTVLWVKWAIPASMNSAYSILKRSKGNGPQQSKTIMASKL